MASSPTTARTLATTDPDMVCVPDPATVRIVPWAAERWPLVIHDCQNFDGTPGEFVAARRAAARAATVSSARLATGGGARDGVLSGGAQQNPHEPLTPPLGRTGKPEAGRQSYSIDAVNDFDPFFLELSSFCNAHRLGVETLIHEAGAGQMEINFTHGDAMDLADRVFLFKRTVRETALRHGIFATFMAKPMETEPGSAMHIHQSILDTETGDNIFSRPTAAPARLFFHYIAGLEHYVPQAMPMFAPYVNSYRRLSRFMSAPTNVHWGYDNRTCGIRIPEFDAGQPPHRKPRAGRGRQSLPGDGGHAGLRLPRHGRQGSTRPRPTAGSAEHVDDELPRHLEDAILRMRACQPLSELLGELFVDAFCEVKELEFATYSRVISSWEREHLMLLV